MEAALARLGEHKLWAFHRWAECKTKWSSVCARRINGSELSSHHPSIQTHAQNQYCWKYLERLRIIRIQTKVIVISKKSA